MILLYDTKYDSLIIILYMISFVMKIDDAIKALDKNRKNVKFRDLKNICDLFFGRFGYRNFGNSHHIYKTPWQGDPRINIQRDGKMAKPYQVKHVVAALTKLKLIGGMTWQKKLKNCKNQHL